MNRTEQNRTEQNRTEQNRTEQNRTEQNRQYLFDNVRAVAVTAVPILHTIGSAGLIGNHIAEFLGLWAVPTLLIISGYFSKDIVKSREKAFRFLFIPYLFFQFIYMLVGISLNALGITSAKLISASVLSPSGPFYFLLALFSLRFFLADLVKIRFLIPISILVGLIIGVDDTVGFTGAIQSACILSLFFFIGYLLKMDLICKIRKIPVAFPLIILICIAVLTNMYSIDGYYMNSYQYYGVSNLTGLVSRILFYCFATLCVFSLFRILPNRKCFLTQIGKNSMMVYVASTFLAPQLYLLLAPYLPFSSNDAVKLLYGLLFCISISFIFSRNCFAKLYYYFINKLNGLLFKR